MWQRTGSTQSTGSTQTPPSRLHHLHCFTQAHFFVFRKPAALAAPRLHAERRRVIFFGGSLVHSPPGARVRVTSAGAQVDNLPAGSRSPRGSTHHSAAFLAIDFSLQDPLALQVALAYAARRTHNFKTPDVRRARLRRDDTRRDMTKLDVAT